MNRLTFATIALVFVTILPQAVGAKGGRVELDAFVRDIQGLTKNDHRLAGFGWRADGQSSDAPGSYSASKYVQSRLRQLGFSPDNERLRLFVQEFPIVQPVTTQCELTVNDRTYNSAEGFHAARPCMLQGSITPADGLTGEAVYGQAGQMDNYSGTLKDKIVFIEYDCDKKWLDAFAFGARAVVFIGDPYQPGGLPVNAYHHLNLPANLPRFYISQTLAEKLNIRQITGEITIKAAVQWTIKRGTNVIAVLAGTDPLFGTDSASSRQAIVLAAPLDSLSEIPQVSPGSRDAANVAALIQMAEYLIDQTPRRDIIFCFFDGQANNHAGARAFYGGINRQWKDLDARFQLEDLAEMLGQEQIHYRQLLDVFTNDDLFSKKALQSPKHSDAIQLLRTGAKGFASEILDTLGTLRVSRSELQRQFDVASKAEDALDKSDPSGAAEIARLEAWMGQLTYKIAEMDVKIGKAGESGLAKEDMDWNQTEKFLYDTTPVAKIKAKIERISSDESRLEELAKLQTTQEKIAQLIDRTRSNLIKRLGLIDQELKEIDQSIALRDRVGYGVRNIVGHVGFNLGDARKRWTFIHGDDSARLNADAIGAYTGLFKTMESINVRLNGWQRLSTEDILDWPGFATALIGERGQDANRPQARLWTSLDAKTRELIGKVAQQEPEDVSEIDKSLITTAFNEVIDSGDFFKPGDFGGIDLAATDKQLLRQPRDELSRGDIQRLNRLVLERAFDKLLPVSPDTTQCPDFEPLAVNGLYDMHHFAPGKYADSGAVARLFAVLNVSVMTAHDRLDRQGHPFDTFENLDTEIMAAQLEQVFPFIKALADSEKVGTFKSTLPDVRYHDAKWYRGKWVGGSVKRAGGGSAMADQPVSDAVVAVIPNRNQLSLWQSAAIEKLPPGFIYGTYTMTDMSGSFSLPPSSKKDHVSSGLLTAKFDPDRIVVNPVTGKETLQRSRGLIDFIVSEKTLAADKSKAGDFTKAAISLFKTRMATVVGYGFNRNALKTIPMRAASQAKFREARRLFCEYDNIATLFAPHNARGYQLFNKGGLALLNNTIAQYTGVGLSLADPFDHPATPQQTSHDLITLNAGRLDMLRRNHIRAQSLEVLNSLAGDIRQDSAAQKSPRIRNSWLDAASSMARRPYIPLVNQIKDLVTAVVILLLLAIPFAYSLERLLIGSPHIYRQIGWFVLFFAITFSVLYTVNPAFRIAATPIIIFLAFGIILLSSLVIVIMTRKLQTEMKKLQGISATVHSADVSRLSTMMAAVHMGISTMRRRPLRTILTAATVVLLTFTILTFASFGSSWGNRSTYKGPLTGPTRIVARQQMFNPVNPGVFQMIAGYLSSEAEVVPRYWICPTGTEVFLTVASFENYERLATNESGDYTVRIASAIGLDLRDINRQPKLRDLLEGQIHLLETNGIFLTDAVARELSLTDADIGKAGVLYAGQRLTYAGRIKEELASYEMLETSSILPVDYLSSSAGRSDQFNVNATQATRSLSETPDVESTQFVNYNLDMNVIIGVKLAQRLGGRVHSFTVYPNEPENAKDIAARIARISELPTYVGDTDGVHRLLFTSLTKTSGLKDLMIPVCLGGLIVFATMLGSVSDREREIYTFSSLGLAPPHVASLFFAEASVYAVIGGMGGYLLGQAVARLVGYLADLGYLSAIEMNYSSTNAIMTILTVMFTVLISTIYPAIKASRSANPGIQRSWKIPPPDGNLYDIMFPFTVSAYDITGVVSFLSEHFESFSDTSLGVFATMESHIFKQAENDMLGIRASVALAPFDLGVTQNFALLSEPSEIDGIDEIRILIWRISGARGDWIRANRVFINELRKQLLIWRTVATEITDQYRQNTLEAWDSLPKEQVDSRSIAGGTE